MRALVLRLRQRLRLRHRLKLRDPRNGRPLVSAEATVPTRHVVIEPRRAAIWQAPRFAGQNNRPAEIQIEQPALEVREYRGVMPFAGTDFVFMDGRAVHPPDFVASRDMPMAERFGMIRIADGRVFAYPLSPPVKFDTAISLLGQCAGNYAHFLTEVLPRLPVIDRFPEYRNAPLLVDDWMPHENHFTLIRMFSRYRRDIVRVSQTQPASVDRLITVGQTAYCVPEFRSWIERRVMQPATAQCYKFNEGALGALRTLALKRNRGDYGARLFLWRKAPSYGNARAIVNMNELARAARRAGFTIIEPMSMSINEQIKAFRDARIVIAPSGAALANLVFTPPECKVLCLAAAFGGAEYFFFSNLMQALGHRIQFVVGPHVAGQSGHPLHRDYKIDVTVLNEAIASIINNRN
jgi:capsular polysaccharide biosynthesis protein